jgi:isopentenyl diphosphate isomerase/L-lactate dehydrogenase-like FMN-dependent dehydrogenase
MRDVVSKIQSVADAEYFAKKRLPAALFQTYEAGSGSDATARANTQAFEDVKFRPRAAVFNPSRNLRTTVLGHEISMPILASSVGMLKIGHQDGEAGVARAAGNAGTIAFTSGATGAPIEEVMAKATGPVFYQLYYFGGRDKSAAIIERVKKAGVSGLVLTVDTAAPVLARERLPRERRVLPASNGFRDAAKFAPQLLTKPAWTRDFLRSGREIPMPMSLREDGSPMGVFESFPGMYQQTPAWDDIAWMREYWDGPIVIKGIVTAEDARRAVDLGATAVVVSNHGGNALDGTLPTLQALPEVVAAVGDEVDVLLDSGVRRAPDVLKAMALGAKAVLLGRAYVYGLMAAGEPGVERIFELFRQGMDDSLKFLGVQSPGELDESFLKLPAHWAAPELAHAAAGR